VGWGPPGELGQTDDRCLGPVEVVDGERDPDHELMRALGREHVNVLAGASAVHLSPGDHEIALASGTPGGRRTVTPSRVKGSTNLPGSKSA